MKENGNKRGLNAIEHINEVCHWLSMTNEIYTFIRANHQHRQKMYITRKINERKFQKWISQNYRNSKNEWFHIKIYICILSINVCDLCDLVELFPRWMLLILIFASQNVGQIFFLVIFLNWTIIHLYFTKLVRDGLDSIIYLVLYLKQNLRGPRPAQNCTYNLYL